MDRRRPGTSLYAGVLFTVLGAIAWFSGQPFVFPSLGPSAFLLAFDRRRSRERLYRVVASHAIGGVAGLLAYTLLGAGVTLTTTPSTAPSSGASGGSSGSRTPEAPTDPITPRP